MEQWIKDHIDIWYKILIDKEKGSDSKVECLTNLIRLVKEEIKEVSGNSSHN